jgi:hypothetical protein
LLQKYEHLFDGTTLGEFFMESIRLQLMVPNYKPINARSYTVPRSVKQKLRYSKEIVRLVEIGVLEEEYSSEWSSAFQSFAIPKKHGIIRVVTDFRKLNLFLKHRMSPISFNFASELELNMAYYHIKLDADGQNLCTIVFP